MDFEAIAEDRKPTEELLVAVPMDIETVKIGLKAAYDAEINQLLAIADAQEITNEDSEKKAIEIAAQAKMFLKRMDEERKKIISAPDAFVRGVNKLVKVFKDKIGPVEISLKKKITDFQWKIELKRREAERKAQEEYAKLQKKIEAEAKKKKVEAPPPPPPPVIKRETVTRAESGASSHIRTEWKMTEIEDFSKVPDDYKTLDTKKVNATIKAGIYTIPGLKIEEVPTTVLRT